MKKRKFRPKRILTESDIMFIQLACPTFGAPEVRKYLKIPSTSFHRILYNLGIDHSQKKQPKVLIGQKFGKLTIVKYLEKDKLNRRVYLCDCECGTKNKPMRVSSLLLGVSKTCGCSKQRTKVGDIGDTFIGKCRDGAKERNLEFNITKEYLWDLFLKQNKKCALTGIELKFHKGQFRLKSNQTASLDRIDSSKGYIEGNVQFVHKDINKMKQNLEQDYFINMCKLVAGRK